MTGRRIAWGRGFLFALGGLLFLLIFLFVLSLSLPGEAILSMVRPHLAKAGMNLSAEEVRFAFPVSVRMRNADLLLPQGESIRLDSVDASFEPLGLFRGLPFRVTVRKGFGSAEVRTSPAFWNPGRLQMRLSRIDHDALTPPLAPRSDFDFSLTSGELRGKQSDGALTGNGSASLSLLRIPIPSRESPVREAEIRDAEIRFALRGGTLHVSSFTGSYEGARVVGTGEVERVFTPLQSTVTLHLTIVNPLEGKVATLFDLVSKNAKNGTLRITGTPFAPRGEFRFF